MKRCLTEDFNRRMTVKTQDERDLGDSNHTASERYTRDRNENTRENNRNVNDVLRTNQ